MMCGLTRAPLITFTKIPPEHVRFIADQKALELSLGQPLRVVNVSYLNDQLSAVTVIARGRNVNVDLMGTGLEYTLKWQSLEDAKQVFTNDFRFYDMVRNY